MADVKGDLAVKNRLDVTQNAKFRSGLDQSYLEIVDQKNPGILGGGGAGDTWLTRDLTVTIHNDFASSINLSATAGDGADFTLPAGDYYVEASCPAFNIGNHVARLADVTNFSGDNAPTVVLGTMEWTFHAPSTAPTGDESVQTRSEIVGRFQLTRSSTLEVQHRIQHSDTIEGFGAGGGFYQTDNVYTTLRMWQLRDDS